MNDSSVLHKILDRARWAPSGDNTQPWRFQILAPDHAVAHCFDTRDHCVYDLDGHPSQIAMGALIETAAIAASAHGLTLHAQRRHDQPVERPVFDLRFTAQNELRPDPLEAEIERRSVQRRPFSTQALREDEKDILSRSLPAGYSLHWLESPAQRRAVAGLLFRSAKLRLTTPEAYAVHRDIIDWKKQFSDDKVPDQALGVDAATTRLMQWILGSWSRVQFFNRFMAGTWMPRIQMDLLPALRCAGHYALLAESPPKTVDDYVAAGRAVQRLWLQLSALKLQMQPEVTPLVFARYASKGLAFSQQRGSSQAASAVRDELISLLGPDLEARTVFFGRVGHSPPARSRSLRLPLERLLQPR